MTRFLSWHKTALSAIEDRPASRGSRRGDGSRRNPVEPRVRTPRRDLMAKTHEKLHVAERDRVWAAAIRTVGERGWTTSYTDAASGTLSFSTGMSMRTWAGQNMTATMVTASATETRVILGGKREQKGNPLRRWRCNSSTGGRKGRSRASSSRHSTEFCLRCRVRSRLSQSGDRLRQPTRSRGSVRSGRRDS